MRCTIYRCPRRAEGRSLTPQPRRIRGMSVETDPGKEWGIQARRGLLPRALCEVHRRLLEQSGHVIALPERLERHLGMRHSPLVARLAVAGADKRLDPVLEPAHDWQVRELRDLGPVERRLHDMASAARDAHHALVEGGVGLLVGPPGGRITAMEGVLALRANAGVAIQVVHAAAARVPTIYEIDHGVELVVGEAWGRTSRLGLLDKRIGRAEVRVLARPGGGRR